MAFADWGNVLWWCRCIAIVLVVGGRDYVGFANVDKLAFVHLEIDEFDTLQGSKGNVAEPAGTHCLVVLSEDFEEAFVGFCFESDEVELEEAGGEAAFIKGAITKEEVE
jgi:hypothetical protein